MTLKNGFCLQAFVIRFISQWMKRSKHHLIVFPPKKNVTWRRHCLIGQSCCSMRSKRGIGWFLESSSSMNFFTRTFAYPTKNHTRLYLFNKPIKSNQIALFPFVCCFCFVCTFSFQGHMKITLTAHLNNIIRIECLSLCSSRSAYDYSMHS